MTAQMEPGRLFPVCCAADLTTSIMTRFLQINQDAFNQMILSFVFVDSLTEDYQSESEHPAERASLETSPFKHRGPEECAALLRQIRHSTGSDIDYTLFAVMDERTLKDDTVLLVQAEDSEPVKTVRVTFELAHISLAGYRIGDGDIEEDFRKSQQDQHGVMRDLSA